MIEVSEICTRTIEAGDRGCYAYEEFFWNLVLDSIECHLLWRDSGHARAVRVTTPPPPPVLELGGGRPFYAPHAELFLVQPGRGGGARLTVGVSGGAG